MAISTNGGVTCGVDVGYGNTKIVVRSGDDLKKAVMPSGAAPLDSMPRRSDSSADLKGGEAVTVGGNWWAAGVEQIHIQNRARMTHDDYPLTDEYFALFLGGLSRIGSRHISLLVTGLPVSQFYSPKGEELKGAIMKRMTGKHFVSDCLTTEVERVMVVPQPMGTFFGIASEPQNASLVTEDSLRTLVVDPGFFSVDWVMMSGRSVLHASSGSSKLATSIILERAASSMSQQYDMEVSRDQLDTALRRGQTSLAVGMSQRVEFMDALEMAARETAPAVLGELRTALRNAGPINLVILTGGGAFLYQKAVQDAFPKVQVVVPDDQVLGNALGYEMIGRLTLGRQGRAKGGA